MAKKIIRLRNSSRTFSNSHFSAPATTSTTDRTFRSELKISQEMTSDTIIDRLGWKPLSQRRAELIKDLVNKCPKGHVQDLFQYFNTRRSDIHSCYTRGNTNLFIGKIRLFQLLSFKTSRNAEPPLPNRQLILPPDAYKSSTVPLVYPLQTVDPVNTIPRD